MQSSGLTELTISALIVGVVVFLLQWGAKHTLDRTLLPRVLDWWARRNSKRALKRADKLISQFFTESYESLDARRMIISSQDYFNNLAFVSVLMLVNLIVAGFALEQLGGFISALCALVFFVVFLAMCSRRVARDLRIRAMVRDFNRVHVEMQQRVTKLLEAGGVGAEDMKTRLASLDFRSQDQE